jgi:hypothetical protein
MMSQMMDYITSHQTVAELDLAIVRFSLHTGDTKPLLPLLAVTVFRRAVVLPRDASGRPAVASSLFAMVDFVVFTKPVDVRHLVRTQSRMTPKTYAFI